MPEQGRDFKRRRSCYCLPMRFRTRDVSRALLVAGLVALALAGCRRESADAPTNLRRDLVPYVPPPRYPEIDWMGSLEEARVEAADAHKPLLIFVRAAWSQPSVVMDTTIWHDSRVLAEAGRFVAARVDLSKNYDGSIPDSLKDFDIKEIPATIIISSDGKILGRFLKGKARPSEVAAAMRDAR